jgi:tetratricopeptide (TPR) repeat protein
MKSKKIINLLLSTALVLFTFSCKQKENIAETSSANLDLPYTTQSEEALNQFKDGLLALDLGDNQRARPHFDKAIELDTDFAVAYVYRSYTSRSGQEFATDVKIANEKNKNLSDAEQLLVELNNAFLTGDADKRMSISKSMVEKYPDVARSHVMLGNAYGALNDPMNARKCYEKAVELNPNWNLGFSSLAGSYIFEEPKDLAKAEEYTKKIVELHPKESRTHISMGDVYRAQQNFDKALASYVKAGELNPNDPVAFSKAGHANTYLGNYDAARKDFEKSGSLSDFPAGELNFKAFTHLYEGNHAKGMAWLKEQAMNLDKSGLAKDRLMSSQANLLNNCMWIAYYLGDAEELKSIMSQYQPLDYENSKSVGSKESMIFHDAEVNFINGMVAILEGNLELAKENAEAQKNDLAPINNPTKLEGYNFLKGEIAMHEKKYADAVTYFEKADLDDIFAKYKLAMANKKAGNKDRAMQILKEISEYNFNDIGNALVRKKVKDMLSSSS